MDTQRDDIKYKFKREQTVNGLPLWPITGKKITKHNCQANSWWMKAAAKFATAGFTSVHSWAENALCTRTTRHTFETRRGSEGRFDIRNFF